MNTELLLSSPYQYKRRYATAPRQQLDSSVSTVNERNYIIQLHRPRTKSIFSFYDNKPEDELITSKWMIVRQRLPDILALSKTYKPKDIRTQLVLLIALMNRQKDQLRRLSDIDNNHNLTRFPTNVMINIGDRSRIISLKRIPPEQMIHVELDDLSFSIPTRQFVIAISHGYSRERAAKYCPPAISDMLINLSKTKLVDDRKQYKRALFKMRIGQMLFFSIFIFIIGMILALVISSTSTLLKLNLVDHTNSNVSVTSLPTSRE